MQQDIDRMLAHCPGIKIHLDSALGDQVSLDELKQRHDAVLLSIGAFVGKPMGIPGEKAPFVEDGVSFLYRVNDGERPTLLFGFGTPTGPGWNLAGATESGKEAAGRDCAEPRGGGGPLESVGGILWETSTGGEPGSGPGPEVRTQKKPPKTQGSLKLLHQVLVKVRFLQ